MRSFLLAALVGLSALAAAQRPVRIGVRHADPWAIKAMMEGRPIVSPEMSTIMLISGQAGVAAAVAAGSNLLMGGVLFVNPTDNSLWWYPAKAQLSLDFLPFPLTP